MFAPRPQAPNRQPSLVHGLRRFTADEEGAAYTLSYVMVIPVYALLLCLIIETCLMLTAKLGTVYSAYAAVRTASVWSAHTTWQKAEQKAHRAAIKTMAPFASGMQPLGSSIPTAPSGDMALDMAAFLAAYDRYAEKKVSNNYMIAKYLYASRHVSVAISEPPAGGRANVTAKVSYDFPFNVPGIGRILGRRGADGRYYYSLTSEATMPSEGPQNGRNTIGIGYGTLE